MNVKQETVEGVDATHAEARALRDAGKYIEGLQQLWDEALVEAVETAKGEDRTAPDQSSESDGQQRGAEDVQYSPRENEYLLSSQEYARLRSNWNMQKHSTMYETRPNGGKLITMDNLLVYTDKKG